MIDGRVVFELDADSKSAAEITSLWNYLAARMEKVVANGTTNISA